MMNMTDMKKPKTEMKEMDKPVEVGCDHDLYPYGLEGTLEEDGLDKLDIDLTDVSVGEKIIIHAVAEVTEVEKTDRLDSDGEKTTRRRLRWQIQKLGIKFQNDFEESFDEAAKKKDE
jgi:hypothetical protein